MMYSRCVACGDIKKANSIFTVSSVTLAVGGILSAAAVFMYSDKVALMLGASADVQRLQSYTSDYLKGLAVGLPLNLGAVFLMPLMNIDGDKKRIALSINVMFVVNLVGDLIVCRYEDHCAE